MTVTVQPAGKLEDFILDMASLDHEPTSKEIENIFTENDMQVFKASFRELRINGMKKDAYYIVLAIHNKC